MRGRKVIIIAGNIAAGKTALAQELIRHLNGFVLLSMDAERFATCGEGLVREQQAEHAFLEKLQQQDRLIYETTAFGKMYQVVEKLLIKEKVKPIRLKLSCHPDECLRRYRERRIHPPMPFRFDIEASLWKIHTKLQQVPGIELDSQHYSPETLAAQIL